MATAGTQAQPKHTEQGPHWWFAGYPSGDLLGATPTLLKNRWLYILERQDGVPVKLHLEVCADKDAKLSQVSGDLRRRLERTSSQIKTPIPVDTVSLPTVIQGRIVRYYFFASPTRLTKAAIAALESEMGRPSSEWIDLKDPPGRRMFFHDGRPPVLLVVDPLTVAVHLHSAYEEALDQKLHYVMPSEKTGKKEAEATRARVLKYQLAQLIALNLLPGRRDPFNVRKETADAMGDNVYQYLESFEAKVAACDVQVDATAARLIEHFKSAPWELLARLHLFVPEDTAAWLNFSGYCIDRLNSCPRGIVYLGGVFDNPPAELAAAGLASEGEEKDLLPQAALVARKAAAGVTTVWAEIFPAAVVLRKISVEKALERMERVYRVVVKQETVAATLFTRGKMVAISHTRTSIEAHQLKKDVLKEDLFHIEEWTKEREGRWPEETEGAHTARVVINVLRAFEIMNLALKLKELVNSNKEDHFEAACDVAGAVLDTAAAFEDALKPTFIKLLKSEARAGASLKFMGAVSSLIDVVLTTQKIGEARREQKTDLVSGYEAARIAAVAGVAGGIAHTAIVGLGLRGSLAVSLGLAASALCMGSFGATIVISLYQEGKKRSAFQRSVNHSVFGMRDDPRAGAEWVRGESFAKWNNDADSLQLQIQTLTYLFANFEVKGEDDSTIEIRLGATPPGAKFKVTFSHILQPHGGWIQAGPSTERATALVDPFADSAADALLHCEGEVIWQTRLDRSEEPEPDGAPPKRKRTRSILVGARPKAHSSSMQTSSCEVQLVFTAPGEGGEGTELLTIPAKEPLRYQLLQQGGNVNRSAKASLPEPD